MNHLAIVDAVLSEAYIHALGDDESEIARCLFVLRSLGLIFYRA
jgi:hypothetical protein